MIRRMLAIAAALCIAGMAWLVGRADAGVGAPLGAQRRIGTMAPGALPPDAAREARQALRESPADGRAYGVLAQVAEAGGDAMGARQLYATAARRWPRERLAHARLAQYAFESGQPAAGMVHLDALLRIAPATRIPVLTALLPAAAESPFRTALVQRLRLDPPWRDALPAALLAANTPGDAALALLDALAAAGPLREAETAARVALLDRAGRHAQARATWLASLPSEQRAGTGLLYDGGFEHPRVSGGYGWRFRPPAGVSMGIGHGHPREGEAAMLVDFDGRAVRFDTLAQFLALGPGEYELRAAADNRVGSTRPFAWRLTCTADGRVLLELPLAEADGWRQVQGRFEVPADCGRQELRLRHEARSLPERQLRGRLWLDAMEIAHLP